MALPSLSKVWHITANNTLVPQGSAIAMARLYMLRLKQILTGSNSLTWSGGPPPAPFTVVGSSNGVTAGMDGVDRWNSTSDIVGSSSGGARSWIVLRSTSIAENFQVLLHCNDNSIVWGTPIVAVSENAGFTGGSTTAPPTATDSQVLMNSTYITSPNDQQRQLHGWISSDGQCVRIVEMQLGWTQAFWLFDKPNNPVAGWPRPWIARVVNASGSSSASSNLSMAYSQFYSAGFVARGNGPFTAFGTGEGSNNLWAANSTLSSVANSFSGERPLWPMGLASTTANNIGRHGTVADLWWKPMGMVNGDSFPAAVETKQFVCVGDIVLPWTGDSTSFLSS
jgi:hypothetical protein